MGKARGRVKKLEKKKQFSYKKCKIALPRRKAGQHITETMEFLGLHNFLFLRQEDKWSHMVLLISLGQVTGLTDL
jgi:hypothetical protein